MLLAAGALKRIHVHQANLKQRRLHPDTNVPCYTIKHKGQTYWANEVTIDGQSRLVERIDNPLSCGARLFVETNAAVLLQGFSKPNC
jgi:hypothetical protein